VLGQFEVGFAAVPGGGPSTRLPGMVGRGRAFEILLGGEDFDGGLAERYGYVNRAVPDVEFVGFVNASRSASRVLTCSRWPTSSASSTLRRFRRCRSDRRNGRLRGAIARRPRRIIGQAFEDGFSSAATSN